MTVCDADEESTNVLEEDLNKNFVLVSIASTAAEGIVVTPVVRAVPTVYLKSVIYPLK